MTWEDPKTGKTHFAFGDAGFIAYWENLLRSAEGIAAVDTWEEPQQVRPLVRATDGTEFYVKIVGGAPLGRQIDYLAEQPKRPPGQPIRVIHRGK
ncbi:hypothetical protein JOF53_006480 [Crossiella equi]|uniref:Uncharacterized protein n=1 Tax=Crossiella equi TaxID=130796 RepID=A0ABS5AM14_9PSEU|nr:hypothetical protein [Crossiella equi]MBP2477608.1 hypothetical protein [Crossiella equi]